MAYNILVKGIVCVYFQQHDAHCSRSQHQIYQSYYDSDIVFFMLPVMLATDWRESSAKDGKRWRQHQATIHGNWIPAIPAGMTGGVSSYKIAFIARPGTPLELLD